MTKRADRRLSVSLCPHERVHTRKSYGFPDAGADQLGAAAAAHPSVSNKQQASKPHE